MGEMIAAMVGPVPFDERAQLEAVAEDAELAELAGFAAVQVVAPRSGFAELYRTHFDDSVRLARFLTGSWDEAMDVVQDAFCGLHRNWRSVSNPEAYLRRSIVNGATNLHRRRGRDRARQVPEAGVSELGAAELTDALAALPERQRAALVLRFHLDLPDAAIADALGVRIGTVASLVHRGLAALHASLREPPT